LRNDARLVLAWACLLPGALGIDLLRRRLPLAGLAAIFVGCAATGLLVFVAPHEVVNLAIFTHSPIFFIAVGWCAVAWAAKRVLREHLNGGVGVFVFGFVLGVGVASFAGWEGWITLDLPPNIHDEYAYLFQAWTYLDGRAAYPADLLSPAFEQVHILNTGVFASRYFPGTGIWLMPFVALGKPIVGMWIAHGLATGFFAMLARKLHLSAGWLTALLIGTAPGMIAFSDGLLSTMPTMAAFGAFLVAWFEACERRSRARSIVAGLAVGFAFICRPLTVVGLALPFAIGSLIRFWRPTFNGERANVSAMIAAFALTAVALPLSNFAVLGTFSESPYSRYTSVKTPSHIYGFDNVVRGHAMRSTETFLAYDDWATNHTPTDALPMVAMRFDNCLREGVGGRLFASLFLLVSLTTMDRRMTFLWLSIVGLAAAYAPYWFVGLLGYGYFAEALPILLTIIGVAALRLFDRLKSNVGPFFAVMWPALVVFRALTNAGDIVPRGFEPTSDAQFARREKRRIEDREALALREDGKILVLVKADPKTAVHSTLVHNHPRLDGPIVRAWFKPEIVDALLKRYDDRAVYSLEYEGFTKPFVWRKMRGPPANR
jgi:hypothetical protein